MAQSTCCFASVLDLPAPHECEVHEHPCTAIVQRVDRAAKLLISTSLPIAAIGREVGFESVTHFNRIFKRFKGHSPGQFRSFK